LAAVHASELETFADAGQYVYISSASVYEKPPSSWLITERTPTVNPFWDYSQHKIDCEAVLRRANEVSGFPVTTVRPSLTTTPFADGIRETVAWFDADLSRQTIDDTANALWDRLAAIYTAALRQAAGQAIQPG